MKRGGELKRSTFMSRSEMKRPKEPVSLKRSGRIKHRNPERAKRRADAGLVKGPYHKWVMTLPCCLAGVRGHVCTSIVDAHHVTTIGAGGLDYANEIPLCRDLHTLSDESVHLMGPDSFEAYWGIDMRTLAESLAIEHDELFVDEEAA